ncbi:uncharacterized protein EI90DRAFT_2213284 [Cantharellus anzutake]|uniref:uncharacterized protein n=1 Tax=Cantharellus anzutake TaxID=1750568 RepID=UPI001906821A|nr:uncharacterized protein EI90DRAFT_2213284 [Cantharellus anzutake]KAF8324840.1 hypothetical protein EI90DRAFT_2213284 [Cantharellus anzutake]
MDGVAIPWLHHRSMSLCYPPESSLYKLYGHLAEPIRIFGISGKILNHLIPLSEASLNAQILMEAKLDGLPKKVGGWGREEINYEAEFREPNVRNGVVTCAALSRDGRYVALGFGSGVIEISDFDDQRTISQFQNHPSNPPAWIEFIYSGHCVATEDIDGNIAIYGHGPLPVKLGTLPIGAYPAVTAVSDSGFFIVRVLRDPGKPWYSNMACIYILGDPHIQPLAPPPSDSSIPSSQSNSEPAFPERHTIAFSPGAQYIAAFDGHSAFTWSTESGDFIARYDVRGDRSWIINPGMAPTCPYHIAHPVSTQPTLPLAGDSVYAHHSCVDAGPDSDESWIKRPFFHHLPRQQSGYSFAAGKTPLVDDSYTNIWFNGSSQLAFPIEYRPVSLKANSTNGMEPWYGDRRVSYINGFYCPQSSKDGTRFLLQGKMKAPIVVDIGQTTWYPGAMLDYDFSVSSDYPPCSTSSDISSPCEELSDDSYSETSDNPED